MVTLILSCQKLTIFDQKVKSCDVWVIFFCKYLIERESADWHGITNPWYSCVYHGFAFKSGAYLRFICDAVCYAIYFFLPLYR